MTFTIGLYSSREGYDRLGDTKIGSNNGFDGVFVKRDPATGEIVDMVIVESKYKDTGKLVLEDSKMKGVKMSKEWIDKTIKAMDDSGKPALMEMAAEIEKAQAKGILKHRANVLNPQGGNRWHLIDPTNVKKGINPKRP